jgi:CubicO group peptidase (beta-lactamase class C family)
MNERSTSLLHLDYSLKTKRILPKIREMLAAELLESLETSFPSGFNLSVVDKSGIVLRAWGGSARVVPSFVPTSSDTLYDLASLTKVVATTTLALWLEENRRWKLKDLVVSWLPGFPRDDLTLYQLITHTSGLTPHRPFFHLGQNPRAIRRALYEEAALGAAPGEVLYSDLNFILLGWTITRCTGRSLKQLFKEVVASPLHMRATNYRPSAASRLRTAATELDGDQRLEPGLIWGEVHDGNAWSLNGVAGHAGLFGPANDLGRFVTALLNPRHHPVLSSSTIARMTRVQAGRPPDVRGLGWRLEPKGWGAWPGGTYWHTGFTGTSLLVAPEANIGVVLLSNAIHPTRQLERQADFRTTIHRTIARSLA